MRNPMMLLCSYAIYHHHLARDERKGTMGSRFPVREYDLSNSDFMRRAPLPLPWMCEPFNIKPGYAIVEVGRINFDVQIRWSTPEERVWNKKGKYLIIEEGWAEMLENLKAKPEWTVTLQPKPKDDNYPTSFFLWIYGAEDNSELLRYIFPRPENYISSTSNSADAMFVRDCHQPPIGTQNWPISISSTDEDKVNVPSGKQNKVQVEDHQVQVSYEEDHEVEESSSSSYAESVASTKNF